MESDSTISQGLIETRCRFHEKSVWLTSCLLLVLCLFVLAISFPNAEVQHAQANFYLLALPVQGWRLSCRCFYLSWGSIGMISKGQNTFSYFPHFDTRWSGALWSTKSLWIPPSSVDLSPSFQTAALVPTTASNLPSRSCTSTNESLKSFSGFSLKSRPRLCVSLLPSPGVLPFCFYFW